MERSLRTATRGETSFGDPESSDIFYRPRTEAAWEKMEEELFEPSDALREQLVGVLLKDAGLETVPVDEAGYAARVPYDEAMKDRLVSLYKDWLTPSKYIFSLAIKQRLDVSALRPQDWEAVRTKTEGVVREALHRPLAVTRQGAPSGDRWNETGGLIKDPYYLLSAQIEALRAMMARHGDWLLRVDELARAFKHQANTGHAWEDAVHDREWLPPLNRVLGFAGIAAESIPPDALKERSLASREGALIPGETVFMSDAVENSLTAYDQGGLDRAAFDEVSHREVALVREMGHLRMALRRYVSNLEDQRDPFDWPDILGWREEIQRLAVRIAQIEQRRGALEKMMHADPDREPEQTRKAMGDSHAALGGESAALLVRLKKVREAYKLVGRHLERLAEQGIIFSSDRPIGLRGLLERVEDRLRQGIVPPPYAVPADSRVRQNPV